MSKIRKIKEKKQTRGVSTRAGIERIFRMVSMLQNASESGKKITCTTLQEEFEVDRATVLRDITFIRDRLAMDLEWDAREGTYVIEENSKFLPPMELKEKDYLLLSFFQQCLRPYESTELGQEMLISFERMFGIFTGTKNWNAWSRTVHFRFAEKPPANTKELKIFNILHRAIDEKKVVEFDYKSPKNAAAKQKSIEPHLMVMEHGRFYFYGTDTKTRRLTPFAFPRVSSIRATSQKFTGEPEKHPRDLLKFSFGSVISTEAPEDVVLEFEAEVVERLKESTWHPNQKLEDLAGGRARLTLRLNSTLEIQPWILGWGPKVKVLAPAALVESIATSARKMAAQYA
jgi:proteasome accessory factor B